MSSPSVKSRMVPPPRSLGKNRKVSLSGPPNSYVHLIAINNDCIRPANRPLTHHSLHRRSGCRLPCRRTACRPRCRRTSMSSPPAGPPYRTSSPSSPSFQNVVFAISRPGCRCIRAAAQGVQYRSGYPLSITEFHRASVMQAHHNASTGILVRSIIRPRPTVEHVCTRATFQSVGSSVTNQYISVIRPNHVLNFGEHITLGMSSRDRGIGKIHCHGSIRFPIGHPVRPCSSVQSVGAGASLQECRRHHRPISCHRLHAR